MSRPLRIEYPGAWYHVMNRGRRHELIFLGREDYQQFMELLQAGSTMWNVRIAAFCLMPNPYHLSVQTPDANLSWTEHCSSVVCRTKQSLKNDRSLKRKVEAIERGLL